MGALLSAHPDFISREGEVGEMPPLSAIVVDPRTAGDVLIDNMRPCRFHLGVSTFFSFFTLAKKSGVEGHCLVGMGPGDISPSTGTTDPLYRVVSKGKLQIGDSSSYLTWSSGFALTAAIPTK